MKKVTATAFMGMVLLALGMSGPSKAYTDKCRGCWSDCFNPLLNGGFDVGGDKNCSHCDALCGTYLFSCSPTCRGGKCGACACY